MEKRQRSPNYPALSLKEAVEKVRKLAAEVGQRPTDRESVAIAMGYSGLSGTSATAISALNKYGLIEGRGDEISVTDRAMAILYPGSKREQVAALREAATEPTLFREIADRFGDKTQNDDLLRNFLLRNKFAPNAVEGAIAAWRETLEFVGGIGPAYDSPLGSEKETDIMTPQNVNAAHAKRPGSQSTSLADEAEVVATYGNKDRGFVFIKATHGLSAKEAMAMAKRAIKSFEDEERELAPQAKVPEASDS